jgi:hypothetical protein
MMSSMTVTISTTKTVITIKTNKKINVDISTEYFLLKQRKGTILITENRRVKYLIEHFVTLIF